MILPTRKFDGHQAAHQEPTEVDIILRKVDPIDGEHEKVIIYGIVDNGNSLFAGFTLVCTVSWLVEGMTFESGDGMAERFFQEFVKRHIDSRLVISDAAFELNFSDPDLGGFVGHGSGFVKFHGGFQN